MARAHIFPNINSVFHYILKEFLIEASSYSKYDNVGGLIGQSCFN